ncbi:MAG: HAMP domain-containing histidine kinase [Treponema sp.]|uniref:sensor histidine kinase n=1 Tax=Treponema sp. TaxID=166 RepID=UPI00298E6F66|nr:HAMP domain-containing sensor histidine kinase [Treponema sp.]MBR5933542.1 HAMP domain-containing histidine kinase [Treponema sp.]
MKSIKLSVAAKLAFRFTFILVFIVIGLTLFFSRIQMLDFLDQKNTEIKRWASFIDRVAQQHIDSETDKELRVPKFLFYEIFKADGKDVTIILSNSNELPLLEQTKRRSQQYTVKKDRENVGQRIYYYTIKAQQITQVANENYFIQIWVDLGNDSMFQSKESLPRIFLISFIPIFLICYLIAYFIARRMIKPVVKMTIAAKQISSSTLDTLLPLKNNGDELDSLAITFNNLFIRLKKDFDRERQFTSDVSHELKTPVAVILGQANLLRRWGKNDPEQLEKSINMIISETKTMQAIIENLLQMSRIQSGRIKPAIEKFLFSELASQISTEITSIDSSAKIIMSYPEDIILNTDYELLHQVMMTGISNSIKFCPKPLVLKISLTQDEDNKTTVSILDNGPGFSDKDVSFVFDRFYRGDDAHTRTAGGSGLGLSIAKTITEALGGTIKASNSYTEDHKIEGALLTITI